MTYNQIDETRVVSRRRILWGGAFAAAAATTAAVWPSAGFAAQKAQKKVAQAAVNYQAGPRNGASCVKCSVFQAPDLCNVVEGTVSPHGWCTLFTPK